MPTAPSADRPTSIPRSVAAWRIHWGGPSRSPAPLCVNVSETLDSSEITVEGGERSLRDEDVERIERPTVAAAGRQGDRA
jgi:hypothetical protein